MENEAPFAVDADVDAQLQAQAAASNHDGAGNTTEYVAKDTVRLQVHEETPLLAGTSSDSGHEGLADDDAGDAADGKWWRTPSIWWLLPCLLLFTLGFGGIAVPKINLILTLVCRDYFSEKASKDPNFTYLPVIFGNDNSQCRIPEVQSLVAQFQLCLNLVPGIFSALVSPRLGHLSDRYGRTKVMAFTAAGAVLGEAVAVLVAAMPEKMSINVLLLGAFLDGIGGSFTTMLALVHAYASDCTRPERRNVAFGYFHGALFTGIALGPTLAAYIIKVTGKILPVFIIALSFHAFFLAMVLFFVPESLSKKRQQIAREKHQETLLRTKDSSKWFSLSQLNPLNLVTPLSILLPPVGRPSVLFPTRRGASPALRRNIVLLAAIDAAMFGVAMGTFQIIIIYAEYMFGWGNIESSVFVSIVNSVRVVNLFLVLPIATRIFRGRTREPQVNTGSDMLDITIIRLSIVFDLAGYLGYASSRHGSAMVFSGVVAALGGMGSPTLQSSLTKHVPRDRVGQMLGATGLLHALARVCAPTIFNLIYSLTVGKFSQTVFVCLAAVFALALCLSFFIRPHVCLQDPPSSTDDEAQANVEGGHEEDSLLRS